MRHLFLLAPLLATLLTAGCGEAVSEDRAIKALHDEGWTNIRITAKHGISPHLVGGCGKDDAVAFDAEGTNPHGDRSTATVCCGLMIKGCTIRH